MVFFAKMPNSGLLLQTLALLFSLTIADTSIYSKCQYPTANPRDGCDSKTIVVSSNSCDADFDTIQGAINSLPQDTSSQTILVLSGNYIEQLNITRSGPLTIIGQTSIPDQQENNTVTVYWTTAFTSVLTVAPNLNASLTGSGNTGFPVPADTPFGCTDFRVYNIDFRNVYAELGVGPSLAVSVSRANAGFYYSGFFSYQDTVSFSDICTTPKNRF
jgi:pectinesterase